MKKRTDNINIFFDTCKMQGIDVALRKAFFSIWPFYSVPFVFQSKLIQQKYITSKPMDLFDFRCISNDQAKNKIIVNIAFRFHDPKSGGNGGPNGVVSTLEKCFGEEYEGSKMIYIYQNRVKYPDKLIKMFKKKKLNRIAVLCIEAIYYTNYCLNIWSLEDNKTEIVMVCHDVGSAYAAYLRRKKYFLVVHTQGCLTHERRSYGEKLTEEDIKMFKHFEDIAFKNANKVFFVSKGAEKAFFDTSDINKKDVNLSSYPVYNTVNELSDKPNMKLPFVLPNKTDYDVFLSIGDWSYNKGLDQIPMFLNEFAKYSKKKVLWIAVGSRHDTGIYANMLDQKGTWSFESILIGRRIPHAKIAILTKYADYYIMFHRLSIFDLSTLEAMRDGCGLVLSRVYGNVDFNKANNVFYVKMDSIEESAKKLADCDKEELKNLNQKVFRRYFSYNNFKKTYGDLFKELVSC